MTIQPEESARDVPAPPIFDIATAPGDLPLSEIQARSALQERQFRHDNTIVPLGPAPDTSVEVWATSGSEMPLGCAALFYTTDGAAPDTEARRVPMVVLRVDWEPGAGYLTRWRGEIPAQPEGTVVRYRIGGWRGAGPDDATPDHWAQDGQGFWFRSAEDEGVTTFAYRVEALAPPLPAWAGEAVIYQIFLDRFHPGSLDGRFAPGPGPQERHGGTLGGVELALPYLAELGVTCLWLSPVCASESYHRYDSTDLYTVDPALGGNAALTRLTGAAHALGMRVLLDLVPSHCSSHHPAFVAAQRDRNAPSYSWFTFSEWPAGYRSFLNMSPDLPSFNTDDPDAREHIIGSALAWLRHCGVDGFRLDHAIGPSMDFWVAYREATRGAAPECFSVGEVTDTPDSLRRYRNRLDGVLDFQLAGALRLGFGTGDWNLAKLDTFLAQYDRFMEDGPGRVSFLDNHDMDRFLYVAGGQTWRLKLAALCQFTLAPTPVVYYGTEIGMSQPCGSAEIGFGGDALARAEMPWDRALWDGELLAFYRALIGLRREHRALRAGVRRTVWLDERAGCYAYLRTTDDRQDSQLLVLFNLGAAPVRIEVPDLSCGADAVLLQVGEPAVPRAGLAGLRLDLAPRSGAVLRVFSGPAPEPVPSVGQGDTRR